MRLISWNLLQGGGRRLEGQIHWLLAHQADVVCLQEYRQRNGDGVLRPALADQGLVHQYVAPVAKATHNTLLIASRHRFNAELFPRGWSGNAHVVRAEFDALAADTLTVFCVHFPQKKAQIPLFESLLDESPSLQSRSACLVGDLNCGIPFEDSQTRTFANTHMFSMLLKRGWVDAWRLRHPDAREYSWRSARSGNGFRYDHLLATPAFDRRIDAVEYDHAVRRAKLSDHSALTVQFAAAA